MELGIASGRLRRYAEPSSWVGPSKSAASLQPARAWQGSRVVQSLSVSAVRSSHERCRVLEPRAREYVDLADDGAAPLAQPAGADGHGSGR